MEIKDVPNGERAPDHTDRVAIHVLPSGKAGFSGIYQAGDVEAHTVTQNQFQSEEDAYQAALAWAEDRRIDVLYVERPDA